MPSAHVQAPDAPAPAPPTTVSRRSFNKAEQDHVDAINALVDRMHAITAPDPYVLTIPQDVEPRYHHLHPFHQYQWLHNAPFSRGEHESIQYQTFHFREPGKDLFVLHNSWVETDKRRDPPKVKGPGTGSNTPNVKTMSFNAYTKFKKSGITPSQDSQSKKVVEEISKKPAVKGPAERTMEADSIPGESVNARDKVAPIKAATNQLKRKSVDLPDRPEPPASSKKPRHGSPTRASKDGRTATQIPTRSPTIQVPATLINPEDPGLPSRLSPLQTASLPSRLSPTLPANIEAALSRGYAKANLPTASSTLPKKDGMSPRLNGKGLKLRSPPDDTLQSRGTALPTRNPSSANGRQSPGLESTRAEETAVSGPSKAAHARRPTCIVKLKYGRLHTKDVERLLRFPSKPTPQIAQQPDVVIASAKALRTPHRPAPKSPSVSRFSTQVTPGMRKDAVSVAMGREISSDGQAYTPSGQANTTPSSSTVQNSNQAQPRSSQPSWNKSSLQLAWETEQKRLDVLGRELKHAATGHMTVADKERDTRSVEAISVERKLAAIKALESMLCYMLAFSCADEAWRSFYPSAKSNLKLWRSLSPYHGFVKRNCDRFPPLMGMTCLLGVAFNARILELCSSQPMEAGSRESTLETLAALQRSAMDADSKLDVDGIMTEFPKAWAARSRESRTISAKITGPMQFGGPYKLPIGVQTPPIYAARACHAMLEEWIGKQDDVKYRLQVRLTNE